MSPGFSFGACFFAHFGCLFVCFYVLGRSAMTPSLGRMCQVSCGTQVHSILGHLSWVFQECPLCELCGPSYCNWVWLLLAHSCVGSALRLANCEDQPWPQHMSCCASADHMKHNLPQLDLISAKISLWYDTCEANWILLWCYIKLATECVGSGTS